MPIPRLGVGQTMPDQKKEPTGILGTDFQWGDLGPLAVENLASGRMFDIETLIHGRKVTKADPLPTELLAEQRGKTTQGGAGIPKLNFGFTSGEINARAVVGSELFAKRTEQGTTGSYWRGFASSAISSLPEFFGMPTPLESEVFRIQNPWMGFASGIVGPAGVYGTVLKLTRTGKAASMLETATARSLTPFGLTALQAPIRAAGMREFLRFTPMELSRLGVGYTIWPENSDNLFGDVLLSAGLNGAIGLAGGALSTFGTWAKPQVKAWWASNVAKTPDIGLMPTFELRLMKDSAAQFEEGADVGKLIATKTNEVLTARPGRVTKGQPITMAAEKPFYTLTDVSEEASSLFGKMFAVNPSRATEETLVKNGMDVRLLASGASKDASRVPKVAVNDVLKSFGFNDLSDVAQTFVFPRITKITTSRMAGQFAKTVKDSGGLQWFEEAQMLLAKDGEGLWVFAKRLGRTETEGAKKSKKFGTQGVSEGDVWLVAKTDRLDVLLPKEAAHVQKRIAAWAQQTVQFRPGLAGDEFNIWMDAALSVVHHTDWEMLKRGTRASGVARLMERVRKSSIQTLGLADNAGVRHIAEGLYDVMVPTARKEISSPIYQRLYGLLKGVIQRGDELTTQIMRGSPRFKGSPAAAVRNAANVEYTPRWSDLESVESLVKSLTPDELSAVANATQVPGSEMANVLAGLSENGLISSRAADVVRQLQEINKRTIDEIVKPALESAGVIDEAKWLQGYIMPRIYRGDYYLDVKHGSQTVYRVSGRTGAETQRLAEHIVNAAKEEKGILFKAGELKVFNEIGDEGVSMAALFDSMAPVGGGDKMVQDAVMSGLKRARLERPGIPKIGTPSTLKERSGLNVADYTWTGEEVMQAIGNHYQQLMRFAGMKTWYARWYPELAAWGDTGFKVMQEDIERKASQFAGIEGSLTKAQNQAVRELFRLPVAKPLSKLVGSANSIMYQLTLGIFNTSFAVLNVVTPLMTAVPWIAMMERAPAYKQLQYMQVLPKVGADGKVLGQLSVLHPLKVLGAGIRMASKPSADEKAMIERAVGDGVLNAQLYENFVGGPASTVGQGLRESWATGGGWEFTKNLSGMPALKSEQFSRLIGFNSAVVLGRDVFGLSDEALYRFAKKATEQMMYGYGLTDRARILTGPMGSFFGLFKNWSFHYINQMAEYANLGVRDGVWAPALWMLGASTAVGGLGATPLKHFADGMAEWASDGESKTAFMWLQNNWPDAADEIYFGLPAMLGASLQSSSMMPGTDVVQDVTNLGNVAAWTRGKQLWDAMSKMKEYSSSTGQSSWANEQLRAQFLGAVMPRAMSRIYATTEDDAIISMRSGYPTVRGVSPTTKALYALGFNQVEVERYQVAGRELYKQKERRDGLVSQLGLEYTQAQLNGDTQHMQRVMQKTIALGLPVSSVLSSARSRTAKMSGSSLDRFGKADVAEYFGPEGGK